jgi:hypothetical protein
MKPKRGEIIINDQVFNYERENTELLKYLKEKNIIRIKCSADEDIVRSMLIEKDLVNKRFVNITVMCKRCKHRYNVFTGGQIFHCECGATSYKSDGLDVKAYGPYRFLLIDPSLYSRNTEDA